MAEGQGGATGLWMLNLTESFSEVNHEPVCTFGGPASTCVAMETKNKQTLPVPFLFPEDSTQQAIP